MYEKSDKEPIGVLEGTAVIISFIISLITAAFCAIDPVSSNAPAFRNPALMVMSLVAAIWSGVHITRSYWGD